MRSFFIALLVVFFMGCMAPHSDLPVPPFRLSESKNTTPTYQEGIDWWRKLEASTPRVRIFEYGMTDAGYPLHIVVLSGKHHAHLEEYTDSRHSRLLINNAIHPGEPDGVDASMMLAYDLLNSDSIQKRWLPNTDIFIIPFYNIGGSLNRNSTTRANQNGPEEYGFRGNAQNLDLNRDFVKSDSRNARTFAQLIQAIDPHLYVETHVSNGADYPYVMTYLSTQEDKIGEPYTSALRDTLTPHLEKAMGKAGFPMVPYVNVHGVSPENGYATFYDMPRYSTGYLALLGIPGYITETHMLKPYEQRVEATYSFLWSCVEEMRLNPLEDWKVSWQVNLGMQDSIALDWTLDSSQVRAWVFNGYAAGYKPSDISGEPRLFYDRTKPYSTKIPYWGWMKPQHKVSRPTAYILRRGFVEVEERLKASGVNMEALESDTTIRVDVFHIDTFSTYPQPYEKHYAHHGTKVSTSEQDVTFHQGDWLIPLNNAHARFIIEVLEPEAPDGYFNWNFFDAVLQQKEWYSPYVFEDEAALLLQQDSVLRNGYNAMMDSVAGFKDHGEQQLYWIYQHSPRYERSHLIHPVYRIR